MNVRIFLYKSTSCGRYMTTAQSYEHHVFYWNIRQTLYTQTRTRPTNKHPPSIPKRKHSCKSLQSFLHLLLALTYDLRQPSELRVPWKAELKLTGVLRIILTLYL